MKLAAQGNFELVAHIICGDPPGWLPVALAHHALMIYGDDLSEFQPELKKRLDQLQEAVRVFENSLPMWQHMPLLKCPPAIETILGALPGLKKEIVRLNHPRSKGRSSNAQREICAAVIIEAWRIIHGQVEARSERLYEACDQYWAECGGASIGAEGDIENWRRTVERAIKSDHQWIRDQLAWISSKRWTDKPPQGDDAEGDAGGVVHNSP